MMGEMHKIDALLEAAKRRSALSALSDDTTLEPPLAAIYLGISSKKLEEMRLASGGAGGKPVGPPFIKMVDARSLGRNQAVFYKLGDLRVYQQGLKVSSSFEATLKSQLGSWDLVPQNFYIRPEPTGQDSVVAATNEFSSITERDLHFSKFWAGELKVRGMSLRRALDQPWASSEKRSSAISALKARLLQELDALADLEQNEI